MGVLDHGDHQFCMVGNLIWSLPDGRYRPTKTWVWRLVEELDWVGVLGLSVSLKLFMYILASEPDYRPPDIYSGPPFSF